MNCGAVVMNEELKVSVAHVAQTDLFRRVISSQSLPLPEMLSRLLYVHPQQSS